jgi:hypothetical protein
MERNNISGKKRTFGDLNKDLKPTKSNKKYKSSEIYKCPFRLEFDKPFLFISRFVWTYLRKFYRESDALLSQEEDEAFSKVKSTSVSNTTISKYILFLNLILAIKKKYYVRLTSDDANKNSSFFANFKHRSKSINLFHNKIEDGNSIWINPNDIMMIIKENRNKHMSVRRITEIYNSKFKRFGSFSKSTIHYIIAKKLHLKYRKINMATRKQWNNNQVLSRLVFLKVIAVCITQKYNLIYMDESVFRLQNANFYSWIGNGVENSYLADTRREKFILLLSVSADGFLLYKIIDGNVDKNVFMEYLTLLYTKIDEVNKSIEWVKKDKQVIIYDNAPPHSATATKGLALKSKVKHIMLPPYSPLFNMTELCFRHIKNTVYKCVFETLYLIHFNLI